MCFTMDNWYYDRFQAESRLPKVQKTMSRSKIHSPLFTSYRDSRSSECVRCNGYVSKNVERALSEDYAIPKSIRLMDR